MKYSVFCPTKELPDCQQLQFPEDYRLVGTAQGQDERGAFMDAQTQELPVYAGSVLEERTPGGARHRCTQVRWELLPKDTDRACRLIPVSFSLLSVPEEHPPLAPEKAPGQK